MRFWAIACAAITVGALASCHKKPADATASDAASAATASDAAMARAADDPGFLGLGSKHGRYAAVGIYQPGDGWTKMMVDQQTPGADAARQLLDQAVIVVTDSQTGEVRACGDMTGYCVGMNPWKTALTGAQIAPIRLKASVKSEANASDNDAGSAAAATATSR